MIKIDVEIELLDRSSVAYSSIRDDVRSFIIDPFLKLNLIESLISNPTIIIEFSDVIDFIASKIIGRCSSFNNNNNNNNNLFNFERIEKLKNDIKLLKIYDHFGRCQQDKLDNNNTGHRDLLSFDIHPYKLNREDSVDEDIDNPEESSPYQLTILPNYQYSTLWENLIYDGNIKPKLLQYLSTILKFSTSNIDQNIISHNKIILLNGPPGTGKTSLCKALAQKISIGRQHNDGNVTLIEINSHSLFSKWFSESGKLVMKVFEKIKELAEDTDSLVVVLIDEVESLTAARKAAISGGEPSDSIRVVNAFLTQLDRLKYLPNVLILTTSNLVGAVDIAFIDRVDIKQFIGPPTIQARWDIIKSCLVELERKNLIANVNPTDEQVKYQISLVKEIAHLSDGFSGRSLRKIPFIAFSNNNTVSLHFIVSKNCSLHYFRVMNLDCQQQK
ncbi:AAA ATPase domain-containing protein [Heterostelium album PN500]|uniref:AAA ATPase domain-containing protein n=1 Tax=Heterostelium pallidum (strain ATCC 26659 / Pp 5 / PN500) TaxID=670386 RepID=D3BBM4_HETP5|nr:AAA ATPase domain-containing protein [Heterostelium album PN500]EFA81057.1 AAA ATPase domain-containing protein [Heterostelium album PN500]|eukprot:XP_020433175.1 AAA ATPase domain-containing protein [Heterostelium album PN500]